MSLCDVCIKLADLSWLYREWNPQVLWQTTQSQEKPLIRLIWKCKGPKTKVLLHDSYFPDMGRHFVQGHQREKSVDLLNQPDMLSAFLSPPPAAEDDWGTQTYHGRSSSRTYDFDEPAYLPDNVEGEMAIPEPQPYIEPEPIQQYDSYGSSPSKDAYVSTYLYSCSREPLLISQRDAILYTMVARPGCLTSNDLTPKWGACQIRTSPGNINFWNL